MGLKIFKFIENSRIKADELFTDTLDYLVTKYGQSRDAFTYASSWGQIFLVLNNHFQTILSYMQDTISESNPRQAQRTNSIYGNAALSGHDAARNRAAVGEISATFVGKESDLSGNIIFLPNYSRVKCTNNGQTYSIDLGADDIQINTNNPNAYPIKVVQGIWDFQIFTGTGEDLQTFEVTTPAGEQIDDQNYKIQVNSVQAKKYDRLADIPFGVLGYVAKTGVDSGISIAFGNDIAHDIPGFGAEIRIDYLLTQGGAGNIKNQDLGWEWIDTGFDITGSEVDLNRSLAIKTSIAPMLGSYSEPPELTKLLSANVSRFNVLHDKESIRYWFQRLNLFNTVKVYGLDELYNDNDCINHFMCVLIPKVQDRITKSEDYFSTDINNFLLSQQEKNRLLNMIEESGKRSANIAIDIATPRIRRFTLSLFIEAFEFDENGLPVVKETLKQNVRDTISDYLLNMNDGRVNKIPQSDIVRLVDNLSGIDTVRALFLSEDGEREQSNFGLDDYGNILVGNDEIAVIRGGWTDRDGVEYDDSVHINNDKTGSLNTYIEFIKRNG